MSFSAPREAVRNNYLLRTLRHPPGRADGRAMEYKGSAISAMQANNYNILSLMIYLYIKLLLSANQPALFLERSSLHGTRLHRGMVGVHITGLRQGPMKVARNLPKYPLQRFGREVIQKPVKHHRYICEAPWGQDATNLKLGLGADISTAVQLHHPPLAIDHRGIAFVAW